MTDLDTDLQAAIETHRQGNIDAAEPVYRRILEVSPDHAGARHMMAVVHLQKGSAAEAEAEARQAIEGDASNALYFNTLGSALTGQGRTQKALEAFRQACSLDDTLTEAIYNLGTARLMLGFYPEAEQAFLKAIEKGPSTAKAYNNLTTACISQNKLTEALEAADQGLRHHPDDMALLTTLASAYELTNDLEAAAKCLIKLGSIENERFEPLLIAARIARRQGRPEEALGKINLAAALDAGPSDMAEIYYEKGLILDLMNQPEEAFGCFQQSNDLQKQLPGWQRHSSASFLERVFGWRAHSAKRGPLITSAGKGVHFRPPVFFVGFPRSGTTLMERILTAHPDVITTQEDTPIYPTIQRARGLAANGTDYPACLDVLGDEDFAEARSFFWREAENRVGPLGGRVLVDTLPLNIVEAGFIKRLLPEARFLIALRDPRDACLSCFIQKFAPNNALANFLDLQQTARTYQAVMGLWLQTRPGLEGSYLEFRYEDLVADLEGTVRSVIDYIGVDWRDEILQHRDVAAPLYTRTAQRWRAYEQQLVPILADLAPFIEAFGYDNEDGPK